MPPVNNLPCKGLQGNALRSCGLQGIARLNQQNKKTRKMKRFTKFFEPRPQGFRGHDFSVDSNSMTVPDVVPTLKEIILSGTAMQVGTPIYDESYELGVKRFGIQSAPLEMLLNGRDAAGAEADERSEENAAPAPARQVQEQPTPSESEGQAEQNAD